MNKSLTIRKLEIAVDNLRVRNALLTSFFLGMQSTMAGMILKDATPALRNKYLDVLHSFVEKEAHKQLEVCKDSLLDEKDMPLIECGYEELEYYLKTIREGKIQ